MAFGFSPRYHRDIQLNDLTTENFLVLAIESARRFEWELGPIHANGFVAYTKFSLGSWSEEVTVTIGDSVTLKSECAGSQLFDWGKNKQNIDALINAIQALKHQFTPDELATRYAELQSGFSSDEATSLQTPYAAKRGFKNFLSVFIPTGDFFVTPILIDLNLAVFLLMVASGVAVMLPDGQSLVTWGANFRPVTLEGQPWRLLTSCFVHIGLFHLLMNMYALAYIGILLEPQLGRARFTAAYLVTGITASATSLWWHDLTVSAGASGAIFGLYGVFLAMLTTDLIEKSARRTLMTSVVVFIAYNLMNGLKAGVDNAAHLGGLVSGLVVGFVFIPSLRDHEGDRHVKAIFLVALLGFSAAFMAYKGIRNDIGEYDKRIKDFVDYESMAMDFYQMPPNAPKEDKLDEIRNRGLYYWDKSLTLIKDLDKLRLPEEVHARDAKLITYCQLRIQTYELIYKAIKEDTDQYRPKIDSLNTQIQEIVDSLVPKNAQQSREGRTK